jgi:alkaline phosphatase D
MIARRQVLIASGFAAGALAAGPAILRAQGSSKTYPFSLGVTAGDPAPDGFVIWTRLAPMPAERHGGMPPVPVPVTWDVSSDAQFKTIVATGQAVARPELGHSVHVEVGGLQPGRPYWYRFTVAGEQSPSGRARTLPPLSSSPKALRFGVCGCQNYEDGLYTAYRHLAGEDLAFVYHYGDFIYETVRQGTVTTPWGTQVPLVRNHAGAECFDLADYRLRYTQYLSDPDLQAARAAQTWLQTFDDHEVANNWAGNIDAKGAPPEAFALRRQAALQAWYEFMPVRAALIPREGWIHAWRGVRYGDLTSIDLLDTRSWRSDQPCDDGFKPRCAGMSDPKARLMSGMEEQWLTRDIRQGSAQWTCVAQQVMMMPLDRRLSPEQPQPLYNLDSWAGYDVPRQRLIQQMSGRGNVIVLTGDEHQNFAGTLDDGEQPVAVEFVSTSITSGGDGSNKRAGTDVMMRNNPHLAFMNDQRGYLVCDVTPDAWTTNFMVMDQVSRPGGQISRRAVATVAHGQPKITMS